MKRITLLGAILGSIVILAAACGGPSSGNANGTHQTTQTAYSPHIDPADFTTKIDNKYFPLKPGTTFVYQGNSGGNPERDEMTVTHSTKRIMGVKCVVVKDRVLAQGKLGEKTFDWYAQDKRATSGTSVRTRRSTRTAR